MNEQYKITIIVAVYNVEKYIQRCVDSLLQQTHHNIEIILVDDGSKDNSPEICDQYAQKDERVKLIHKLNGGVSSARQAGLDAATGDFVIHADPDDYVDADMIETLLVEALATNADIVTCDFYMNERVMKLHYMSSADLLKKLISVETICVCWNSMVRRDFIVKHHVSFTPSWLCMSEDFLFICRLLVAGAKAVHLQRPFYHYWVSNNDSLTNKKSEKKLRSIMRVIDEMESLVCPKDYDDFFIRKRLAIFYAFNARFFHKLKNIYPEVHGRLIAEGKASKNYSYEWIMAHAVGKHPCISYYRFRTHDLIIKINCMLKNIKGILKSNKNI